MGITSNLTLYLLLIAAVVGDMQYMKVSNRLIVVGIFSGLGFSLMKGGPENLIRVLSNMFFPVILLFIFYLLGVIGPGDIKLFSVIGCYFEFRKLCACIVCSFALAGAVSLVQLIRYGRMKTAIYRGLLYFAGVLQGKTAVYAGEEGNQTNRIHFTIEILTGALLASLWAGSGKF